MGPHGPPPGSPGTPQDPPGALGPRKMDALRPKNLAPHSSNISIDYMYIIHHTNIDTINRTNELINNINDYTNQDLINIMEQYSHLYIEKKDIENITQLDENWNINLVNKLIIEYVRDDLLNNIGIPPYSWETDW